MKIKTLFFTLWQWRAQFARYFIIGISGVILDIGTLFILKENFHLSGVWSVIINQFLLWNYGFFLNKYWSFKSTGFTQKQIGRFYLLALANLIFAAIWIWFWHDKLGLNAYAVRLINIALSTSWNFLLYKYWVYKEIN